MYQEEHNEPQTQKRLIFGLIFVVAGVLLLLRNLGLLPFFIAKIFISWQMLLIAIGVLMLTNQRKQTSGIIFISIGIFFLIPKLFIVPALFGSIFWPIILIASGILLVIFHKKLKFKDRHDSDLYD